MVKKQMAADDVLAAAGAGGNGRPPANFGSHYYYVSFLGMPSTVSPWMLQYGGHHLAINATVVGPSATLSPTLTGGEPLKVTVNGEPVHIAEDEVDRSSALLNSLTNAQCKTAITWPRAILDLQARDAQRLPALPREAPAPLPRRARLRYNHRVALGFNYLARTAVIVRGVAGKRLTYKQPHGACVARLLRLLRKARKGKAWRLSRLPLCVQPLGRDILQVQAAAR